MTCGDFFYSKERIGYTINKGQMCAYNQGYFYIPMSITLYNQEKRRLSGWGWLLVLLGPYLVLVGLVIIAAIGNASFVQSAYCPLPPEEGFWVFSNIPKYWYVYAIAVPIVELVLTILWFVVSGVYFFIQGIVKPEERRGMWRRTFVRLPLIIPIVGIFLFGVNFILLNSFYWWGGGVLALIIIIFVVLAELGISVWLLVVGVLQKKNKDAEVKRRGTRMILASVLGFCLLLIVPLCMFVVFLSVNNPYSRSYETVNAVALNVGAAPFATTLGTSSQAALSEFGSSATIGFAVGGAKDVDNFRENITACFLPLSTDVTHEGLFFDYTFDTSNKTECTALFCPQYEAAILPDPFNGEDEYFLSVGLGSNLKIADFVRPALDVVVVLDISGSMSSPFDRYHYDSFGGLRGQRGEDNDWEKSKMEVAKEAVSAMVDHLRHGDRFGMVIFDDAAELFIPFREIDAAGHEDIKDKVVTLVPRGGTNMEAGLEVGTTTMQSLPVSAGGDRERRIIFLTDAQPNTGALGEGVLYQIGSRNARGGIHTTFIGIGVDFNTSLVQSLVSEVRGANYFAVHSSSGFRNRLDSEFEYLIAPLLYDLTLSVEGGDYKIREVYGSPEKDRSDRDVLRVTSLFPSPTTQEGSKGGVIVAHMVRSANTGRPTKVVAKYTDRQGVEHAEEQIVAWDGAGENPSVTMRKAVLLARYVNLLQNWLIDERLRKDKTGDEIYKPVWATTFYNIGLPTPRERHTDRYLRHDAPRQPSLSRWERSSESLTVSKDYKEVFADFSDYFEKEHKDLNDLDLLERELELLRNLTEASNPR